MKKQGVVFFVFSVFIFLASQVNAVTVDIADYDTENGGFVQGVIGTWTDSTRISFSDPGDYSLELKDLTFPFGGFDFLGAMISTTHEQLSEYRVIAGVPSSPEPVLFSIDNENEYWLTIFATSSQPYNFGTFSLTVSPEFDNGTEVPLPPALGFFLASFLIFLPRQKKKLNFFRKA